MFKGIGKVAGASMSTDLADCRHCFRLFLFFPTISCSTFSSVVHFVVTQLWSRSLKFSNSQIHKADHLERKICESKIQGEFDFQNAIDMLVPGEINISRDGNAPEIFIDKSNQRSFKDLSP
jgi:hypothetical protein